MIFCDAFDGLAMTTSLALQTNRKGVLNMIAAL